MKATDTTAKATWDTFRRACTPHRASASECSAAGLVRRLRAAGFTARRIRKAERSERGLFLGGFAMAKVNGREVVCCTRFGEHGSNVGCRFIRLTEGLTQPATMKTAFRKAREADPGTKVRTASIILGCCLNPTFIP